ncbi:MAG: RNA polymerase sigma factor [Myxococcota bacterium]|nr:RNA polymerase sigma factor [Myxococcota bacterium]
MSCLAAGDAGALGELYRRYDRMVKAALCQFSPEMSVADVEEIAQDVFIAVFEMAHRYRKQAKFRGWLYGIAARKARDWRRKTWVRRRLLSENTANTSPAMAWQKSTSPSKKTQLRQVLRQMLSSLSQRQREVLVLHVVEGLKGHEIAALLGIRPQTVRTSLHRAKKRLLESEQAKAWRALISEKLP